MSIRDVMMIQDMGMVKSVQRGAINTSGLSSDRYVVAISPVNVGKSIVILNADNTGSSYYTSANGKLQSSSELSLSPSSYNSTSRNYGYNINWQVIEFY